MKQTAVVIAPGRGTYNSGELGYLARYHSARSDLLDRFDEYRTASGQETVRDLDGASSFSPSRHTRGDNASPLIFACAYFDYLSIDRDRYEVVAVTGNSMGWYIALACAGALEEHNAFQLVNTMGTLMQDSLIGGQIVYPLTDSDWCELPGRRAEIEAAMQDIDRRHGHDLALSIDLGGSLVLAGNEEGLAAFESEMPKVEDRFPMRLRNHAAFHTSLQEPVAADARAHVSPEWFEQPLLPLIDGRGGIWYPWASDPVRLRDYTLGHQVVKTYGFADAVATAAREFMPEVFIVLGPGTTLSGSVAQSLVRAEWRGWTRKSDFQYEQEKSLRLIAMGQPDQRSQATGRM